MKKPLFQLSIYNKILLLTIISRVSGIAMIIATWLIVNINLTREEVALYFLYINILTFYGLVEQGISSVGIIWIADELGSVKNRSLRAISISSSRMHNICKNIELHFKKNSNIFLFFMVLIGAIYFFYFGDLSLTNLIYYNLFCILFYLYIRNMPQLIIMEGFGLASEIQLYRIFDILIGYSLLILSIAVTKSLVSLPLWMLSKVLFQHLLIKLIPIKYEIIDKNLMITNDEKEIFSNFIVQKNKMIITNISGFFIFNISIPYVYLFSETKLSAAYSQTYSIFNQIFITISNFITNNLANYIKDFYFSKSEFIKLYIFHCVLYLIIYLLLLLFIIFLYFEFEIFQNYLLATDNILLIFFAFLLLMISNFIIIFDRMRKVENFSFIGIISAVLTLLMYFFNYFNQLDKSINIAIYSLILVGFIQLIYSIYVIYSVSINDNN